MWNQKGKYHIVLKDEGYGIMIQASQSQQFGFGYPSTFPYLQTIDEYCALHSKYFDTESSTTIMAHTHKEPITMVINIFFQYFEYGASDKLFWTYESMVLKLEDYYDILKAIHPGIYFIFLFDYSCRRDRGR